MIPKIIHYCWFGLGQMPELAIKCINSWIKHLPDYELVLWNEDNFDINSNQFVKEAYEAKKYAFVTDYVRLHALYHYGGIYMDTDVEVIKPLDEFLKHRAFTGCENEKMCVTGIMGAEKGHRWIEDLLSDYVDKKFIFRDGSFNKTPNTQLITHITIERYGWNPQDVHQVLREDLNIYPFEVFCAKDWQTGKVYQTKNTYTSHHFSGSWLSPTDKIKAKIVNLLNPNTTELLVKSKKRVYKFFAKY